MGAFGQFVRMALVTFLAIFFIAWLFPPPRDSTDPDDGRSGLRLYTDHLTGCQYIAAGGGGSLTPRVDANGMHLCKEVK